MPASNYYTFTPVAPICAGVFPGGSHVLPRGVNTTLCRYCTMGLCDEHYPAHNHSGPWCYSCNFAALSVNIDEGHVCENCGLWFCALHTDHEESCDYEGEENNYGSHPPVRNWDNVASLEYLDEDYEFHPLMRGQRAATVELEVEYTGEGERANKALTLPDDCGVTDDGSLDNGIEVTLPPSKGKRLVEKMFEVTDLLKSHGYSAERTCGMHVHINLLDKRDDKRFLSHLFNAFYAFEDILYAMQEARRHNSTYSQPLRNNFEFYSMYGKEADKFDFNFYGLPQTVEGEYRMQDEKSHKYGRPRYSAANFHSMYYRGSLEVRIHEGCLDAEDALRWIDVLQHMIDRVENGTHSYKFMTKMANTNVTRDKVRAFARYFRLTPELRTYVESRITNGQGWEFRLPVNMWGTPKRGRPTKIAPTNFHLVYVGRRVMCYSCDYQFMLRRNMIACPYCARRLFNAYEERNYRLAPARPRARTADAVETIENMDLSQWWATPPIDTTTFRINTDI